MKIIVYDDNPDFGGHQTMTCHGIEALASNPSNEIIFMLNPENTQLRKQLSEAGICSILESPCKTRRPQGIRNLLDHRGIHRLLEMFRVLNPDLILCSQGDIEQSSQAIIAARKAGINCISYLALPQTMATMGARLGKLRDLFNRRIFKMPNRYITISDSMVQLLRMRGARQPVTVVPNGIPAVRAPRPAHKECPAVLGLIGRIEFKQKQQDFMVRTFCSFPEAFRGCTLLMIGDGPDRTKIEQLVSNSSRSTEITLEPWQKNTSSFFSRIDMLIIPSRYEGVPLVMFEALAQGIPVIGSDRGGMQDTLPADWIFEAENEEALADTFSRVRETWKKNIDAVQQHVLENHSLNAFKQNFIKAVLEHS